MGIHEPVRTDGVVEKSRANSVLDLRHCVSQLFCDSLTLQSIDSIGLGGSRHDDERHH